MQYAKMLTCEYETHDFQSITMQVPFAVAWPK